MNPSKRFPTVYCLHGLSGNPISRSRQVVPSLDSAIASGKVQPIIYVFPDGQRNSFTNFRTLPGRAFCAIEGFSLGGYGAAMLGAMDPELFGAIAEYAGALAEWPERRQM